MTTKIVKIDPLNIKEEYINEAAGILAKGGLVIIPTETVYGIAANMLDKKALDKLYEIKKRPQSKKFSLHIAKKENVEDFARDIPTSAYKLMDKFWPGPLTLLLKSKESGAIGTSTSLSTDGKGSRTIGIRMPANEAALRIIEASGAPIVCPSANISGEPAPVNFQAAIKSLIGLVDFAIDSGSTSLGKESSVVDLTATSARILREAAIEKEDIENALKKKIVLFICTGNSCRSVMAKGLLEKRLREENRDDVEVLSAGIMILEGLGVSQEAGQLLKGEGIDASAHRSQKATKNMINKSDIILVMERLHEERILQIEPRAKNKLFLLKEFANSARSNNFNLAKISNGAKIKGDDLDISDPIGKSSEFYKETFNTIKESVGRIVGII